MSKYEHVKEVAVAVAVEEAPVIEVTEADLKLGRTLGGTEADFDYSVGLRLSTIGVAAQGEFGWMRGHKWHDVYGG